MTRGVAHTVVSVTTAWSAFVHRPLVTTERGGLDKMGRKFNVKGVGGNFFSVLFLLLTFFYYRSLALSTHILRDHFCPL